jgi:hypothetical protein
MVISAPQGGRTGNAMFYYAFSYLLATRLKMRLVAQALPWFPETAKEVAGEEFWEPTAQLQLVKDTSLPMSSILSMCRNRRVLCHGAFERTEYYHPHRDELLQIFHQQYAPQSTGIVFSFRGTDFIGQQKYVTIRYYMKCWELLGEPDNVKIVTDDLNDPTLKDFLHYTGLKAPTGIAPPLSDFLLMRSANVLVISRSTFSWWAAFLSDAYVIQAVPVKDEFTWRDLSNPDWFQLRVENYFPK